MNDTMFELMFIPSNLGMIKIFIYGFNQLGDSGEVSLVFNEVVIKNRGFDKRLMIYKSFQQLNQLIAEQ